jgi:hypothetical protein
MRRVMLTGVALVACVVLSERGLVAKGSSATVGEGTSHRVSADQEKNSH